jgi:cytochrome c
MRHLLGCLAATLAMTQAAFGITPAEQRGKNFVLTNCSRCHAIEQLQESLAEGIVTGHPTMPQFRLEPDQINDVLSYLKSLE